LLNLQNKMKVTGGVYIRKKSVWNCVVIVCGIVY
jgi:hypothetical protein